ncbi:MAG: hypothetical protein RBR86_09055 [Pseudobdellovibrionaceae bacterium]|jgi:hypothetical protein|nr:hypothetical protein [Pseudobdellovibrionaceae bacterium]
MVIYLLFKAASRIRSLRLLKEFKLSAQFNLTTPQSSSQHCGQDSHHPWAHVLPNSYDLTMFPFTDVMNSLGLFQSAGMRRPSDSERITLLDQLMELQIRHSFDRPKDGIKRVISGDHAINQIKDIWIAKGFGQQSLIYVDFIRPDQLFPANPPKSYTLLLIADHSASQGLGHIHFYICGLNRYSPNTQVYQGLEYMPYEIMYMDADKNLKHYRFGGVTEELAIKSFCYGASAVNQIYRGEKLCPEENSQIMMAQWESALAHYNRLVLDIQTNRFHPVPAPPLTSARPKHTP